MLREYDKEEIEWLSEVKREITWKEVEDGGEVQVTV
jgi:hypothetical protein